MKTPSLGLDDGVSELTHERNEFEHKHGPIKRERKSVTNEERDQILELYFEKGRSYEQIAVTCSRNVKGIKEIINRSVVAEDQGSRTYESINRTDRTGKPWSKRDRRRFKQWRAVFEGKSKIKGHPKGFLPNTAHLAKILGRDISEIAEQLKDVPNDRGFGL